MNSFPSDRRAPAAVPDEIMQAAMRAYQGEEVLDFPHLDFVRLTHAVRAAIDQETECFRRLLRQDSLR